MDQNDLKIQIERFTSIFKKGTKIMSDEVLDC